MKQGLCSQSLNEASHFVKTQVSSTEFLSTCFTCLFMTVLPKAVMLLVPISPPLHQDFKKKTRKPANANILSSSSPVYALIPLYPGKKIYLLQPSLCSLCSPPLTRVHGPSIPRCQQSCISLRPGLLMFY